MRLFHRKLLRNGEITLAILVLLVATFVLTDLHQPFPSGPRLGGAPVDPELLLPGLLGVVALLDIFTDSFGVKSVAIGVLAVVTLSLATNSLYALYSGTANGIFTGGLFTLVVGIPLAIVVLVRGVGRKFTSDGVFARLDDQFGGT